jgi:hypothetical protein
MEPEGSLPHQQVPANCPFPEPARSSLYPTSHFLKIHLNIYAIYTWVYRVVSFPQDSPPKLCIHLRATCPVYLIILDLITRTILDEEYRSLDSLCSFLHSHVTSPLLGPNILNTQLSNTLNIRRLLERTKAKI